MNELDLVALTESIPEHGLEKGDVGTIVAVYDGEKGYEIEFATYTGETVAVITAASHQIRSLREKELMSTRILS